MAPRSQWRPQVAEGFGKRSTTGGRGGQGSTKPQRGNNFSPQTAGAASRATQGHKGAGRGSSNSANMDDDNQPKGDIARVQRRRGGEYHAKNLPDGLDPATKEMFNILFKQVMILTKSNRELRGALITTIKAPVDNPLVMAIDQENYNYAMAVREAGAGHDKGPPSSNALMGFLEALMEQDVGQAPKNALREQLEKLEGMQQWELQDMINVCRIEKSFKSEYCKILIMVRSPELRDTLCRATIAIELSPHVGAAPPGFLEDEMACWLTCLA